MLGGSIGNSRPWDWLEETEHNVCEKYVGRLCRLVYLVQGSILGRGKSGIARLI